MKKHKVQNRYMTEQTKKIVNSKENTLKPFTSNNTSSKPVNMIHIYINQLIRSDSEKINCDLNHSIKLLLKGAYYYPHLICDEKDLTIFNNILGELTREEELKFVNWSKHYKIENPRFSDTFNKIIEQISKIFDVTVCETRLNYYKDRNDWKPLHHDSHAYGNNIREDFTIGISFGASRELLFVHEKSGNGFKFPQGNGDVFAFDHNVNKDFLHGVTKSIKEVGPRISLVAWCKQNNQKQ